ncbi:MAG: glycosyltransferase [Synechococcaceae cyanobacterium]|nr:glycosyltransferase [Synechococcaceae cyanobacterium]
MTASAGQPSLAVAIPSYGRDQVLIDTVSALLALAPPADELLVIDQTANHAPECQRQLELWQGQGRIRWLRLPRPSITAAMNLALLEARSDRVLFLDDDILPDAGLLQAHREAAVRHPGAMIAGRVLQPWHQGHLDADDAPFRFNSAGERELEEFMGGNVSLDRRLALDLGGFDRHFVRVAYRFEAEFAFRWRRAGHRIRYAPTALIHHLKVSGGGTRSYGHHLTTLRPDHAVGRYYFLWRTRSPLAALGQSVGDLLGSVRSRHHLRHPWWIPLTLVAETRGWLWALRLALRGPALLPRRPLRLLVATSHPIQYQVPLFRRLAAEADAECQVLFLSLPDAERQGSGFQRPFQWDLPLLDGYRWRQARSCAGDGDLGRFLGLWLRRPGRELAWPDGGRPDALLITGWHCLGLMQLIVAARLQRLPILLRMEANDRRRRSWPVRRLHRWLLAPVAYGLAIGSANARFLRANGIPAARVLAAPYGVDNGRFAALAQRFRPQRQALRERWDVPPGSFCFLFCGKLQPKKRPRDLLAALHLLQQRPDPAAACLLIVGSGELEDSLRREAEQLDLPVRFAGFLNQGELPAAYIASDALVLPSDAGETWGLVVNEAMACELPAIVSDRAGCAEDLIQPGITGLSYPCGDVQSLAAAMAELAADPLASQRMGREAHTRVLTAFSPDQTVMAVRSALCMTVCSDTAQS